MKRVQRIVALTALAAVSPSIPVSADDAPAAHAAESEWPPYVARPARVTDLSHYPFVRTLQVPASSTGLARVELDRAMLSVVYQDLRDLRIVDARGQQWPFVRLDKSEVRTARLPVEAPIETASGSVSTMRLGIPTEVQQVCARVPAQASGRNFWLRCVHDGEPTHCGSGVFGPEEGQNATDDFRVCAGVTIASPHERIDWVVADGEEASALLTDGEIRYRARALLLGAPQGSYRLVYGHSEAGDRARAAHYDLERTLHEAPQRSVFWERESPTAHIGSATANPSYQGVMPQAVRQIWVWSALISAVLLVVLLAVRASCDEEHRNG